jgi:hypothetical protein
LHLHSVELADELAAQFDARSVSPTGLGVLTRRVSTSSKYSLLICGIDIVWNYLLEESVGTDTISAGVELAAFSVNCSVIGSLPLVHPG